MNIEEEYDKIYRYCYFKLHDKYLAEDITQETILRFLESDSYRDTGRPLAYLYTVAKNLCIDTYRRKLPEPVEAVEEQPQEGFEAATVDRLVLKEAMDSLTEQEQELVMLRYVNEVPMAVLSNMYGKSRFALYRELNKITKKLERRISDGT